MEIGEPAGALTRGQTPNPEDAAKPEVWRGARSVATGITGGKEDDGRLDGQEEDVNDAERHARAAAEIEEWNAFAFAEIERLRVEDGETPSSGSDVRRVLQSPVLLRAPGTSAHYHSFNPVLTHHRSGRVSQFVRGAVRYYDGSAVPMHPDALYALARICQYDSGGWRVVSESGWQQNTGSYADAFTSFGPMPDAAYYLGETWVGHYLEALEPSGATETRFSLGGPVTPGTLYVPAAGVAPLAVEDEPTPPTDVKPPKPPKPAKAMKDL